MLWRVPPIPKVNNLNTDTVLVSKPLTEYLARRPLTAEAIHNMFELKSTVEVIRYYHAMTRFPTNDT